MFNCFMSENTGCTKKSSAIKKVSITSRNRRTSTEERDGKDGDSELRRSRLISAYLADDSYNAGKDIVRKVSIEETVFKRPDKEKWSPQLLQKKQFGFLHRKSAMTSLVGSCPIKAKNKDVRRKRGKRRRRRKGGKIQKRKNSDDIPGEIRG